VSRRVGPRRGAEVKDDSQLVSVRVTAVVVDDGHILLVRQHVDDGRQWSLPGGRLERGEQIGDALVREVEEETSFVVEPDILLYVADVPEARPPLVHITMSMRAVGGQSACLPTSTTRTPSTTCGICFCRNCRPTDSATRSRPWRPRVSPIADGMWDARRASACNPLTRPARCRPSERRQSQSNGTRPVSRHQVDLPSRSVCPTV